MQKIIGVVLLLMLSAVTSWAQTEAEDFEAFKILAEQGDADAQVYLGNKYLQGEGVPQNYTEALTWFEKAAQNGNLSAQKALADIYREGVLGVPQNPALAFKWMMAAANQQDAEAMYWVGMFHYNGTGTPKNDAKAFAYTLKAAEAEYVKAMLAVGLFYAGGVGIDRDTEQGFAWYFKAAERHNVFAQMAISLYYTVGMGVERDVQTAYLWALIAKDNQYETMASPDRKADFDKHIIELENMLAPEVRDEIRQKADEWWEANEFIY